MFSRSRPVEMDLRAQVSALALMLEQSPTAYLGSFVSGVIYVRASWNHVKHVTLIDWFIVLVAMLMVRFWYYGFVQKKDDQYWAQNMGLIKGWIRIGASAGALVWGATAFFLDMESVSHFAISIFIVSGLAAGGMATYCVDRWALISFLFCVTGPYALQFGMSDKLHLRDITFLTVFYGIMLFVVATHVGGHKLRELLLNIENEKLIQKLNLASHEIRAPVTAIFGFAELLEGEKELTKPVRHYAEVIYRNSLYLKRLVDDVLLLSALEKRPESPDLNVVTVDEPMRMVAELFERSAREKSLLLKIEVDTTASGKVQMDILRVQQILINLVGNAIKFTERGEVTIRASRGVDCALVYTIVDTGIGIDTQSAEKVFEPFWRERRLECRGKEGTGLGLALARRMAEGLNGQLRLVKSEPGQGSVFEVRLPVTWI